MQKRFGPLPDGYLQYFTSRFPQLLMYTYRFIERTCKDDPAFRDYFRVPSNVSTSTTVAALLSTPPSSNLHSELNSTSSQRHSSPTSVGGHDIVANNPPSSVDLATS
jgi:hypothetical protein